MNFQEPYRIHQIDFDNLIYTKIKKTDTKKIIFIKYQDNKKQTPLVIQLPSLLNINETSKVTNDYHELEIPLITQEEDKSLLLYNFFEDLDKKIMNDAKHNSHMWFDELHNKEVIKYKKIIKESDLFAHGAIKIKIIKNNDFETMLQIDNKNRINVKNIPTNYWCKMLIEVYALVINSQTDTFSLFLRPIILSFKEKQSKIYNYKFLEDSESEKDEMDVPDSELSNIFIKQKNNKKSSNIDLTSSQVFINDNSILEKLNRLSSNTSSEKMKDTSTSSSSNSKLKDSSSSSSKLKDSSSSKLKDSSSSDNEKLNKISESTNNNNELVNDNNELVNDNNELVNDNNELVKEKNELKLLDLDNNSTDSSDKIKLTDSSSELNESSNEEEYINKIKKELETKN